MGKKYKVVGYAYEFCHKFELGELVEFVGPADESLSWAWYRSSSGLEQILLQSELEEVK